MLYARKSVATGSESFFDPRTKPARHGAVADRIRKAWDYGRAIAWTGGLRGFLSARRRTDESLAQLFELWGQDNRWLLGFVDDLNGPDLGVVHL